MGFGELSISRLLNPLWAFILTPGRSPWKNKWIDVTSNNLYTIYTNKRIRSSEVDCHPKGDFLLLFKGKEVHVAAAITMCPKCGIPVFLWTEEEGLCVSCGSSLCEDHADIREGSKGFETESANSYREAAHLGNTEAMLRMGWLYEMGRGVAQDHDEAFRWFRKAALTGCPIGQSRLGSLYLLGHGVPRDPIEAAKWYLKAAQQGDVDSQRLLGYLYFTGQGVAQNYVEASFWLSLACSGHVGPYRRITSIVALRDDASQELSPEQFAAVQRRVNEWKPSCAKSFLIERREQLFDTIRHWFQGE